jgi:Tol biopolymer transport system component/imidazolonepropionase-like amidohydrolase
MTEFGGFNMHRICIAIALALLMAAVFPRPASAQEKKVDSWDVAAPHGPTKDIEFVTDEGTWIDLDLSPNGKQIVFDLLGDIYIMPAEGGEATLLSGGTPYEVQPRFSPDGKKISFTSDREGGDNIWVMDVDGKNRHSITKEKTRLLNNAVWTPDGQYLIARKHFVNTRSLGAGEMWMYHISGGDGVQLTKRRNWQQNAADPSISPDGRYVFYDEDVSPGNQFDYNRDPYGVIYVINRFDRETGKLQRFVSGAGGSVRPQISPDGKMLAFVRRVRLSSVLYLRDIETGEEWPIFEGLSKDAQEVWAIFGLYPNFAWTPDGKQIVISAKGKIWNIDVATRTSRQIPFTAHVKQTITEAIRFPQQVAPEEFDVKMLRWVTTSPDGKSVVYNALGHLWVKSLPDGAPHRLTGDRAFEFYPSWSPDGKWIVYTTWEDADKGAVCKVRSTGGTETALTATKGIYTDPSFSRDGRKIVFVKQGPDRLIGQTYATDPGVYWIPAEGGTSTLITEEGSGPLFNRKGDRIFLTSNEGEKVALISVDVNGEKRRVHVTSDDAQQIVPSPDERWVAFTERYNSYIATLPLTGQPMQIGPSTTDFPVKRVTRDAGMYLHWSPDSKTVYWSLGPELYSRTLAHTFTFVEGAPDSLSDKPDTTGLQIGFRAKTDRPSGRIALTGATIISMKGDEVISNGTILIEENRIQALGTASTVAIPEGTRTVDVGGKYIMPGMVDVHAHGPAGSIGITPQQNWAFFASLAFGVTTEHDPSNDTEEIFASSELLKCGIVHGPRLYSTGTILYGAEGSFKAIVNNLDDARSHLRRMKAVGAFTVKSYNQPRRDQRQQILAAARELGIMVVPEGGSTFFHNMAMILDGHTGIEHSIPVAPMYKDAVTLFARSEVGYTPTLIVSYGGLFGENYWYMHSKVWENERLLTFVPRSIIDARSRRRMMVEDDDWGHIDVARSAKKVLDAGGKVQLGAHGQIQGLGAHWELWMLTQGGMTPMEAIRCATINGARYIGLDKDLGSLEPGKLADLVVMERNPLEDIHNSESIQYVMVNGRLFDAATMDQIGNHPSKRAPFYWDGGKDPAAIEASDEKE